MGNLINKTDPETGLDSLGLVHDDEVDFAILQNGNADGQIQYWKTDSWHLSSGIYYDENSYNKTMVFDLINPFAGASLTESVIRDNGNDNYIRMNINRDQNDANSFSELTLYGSHPYFYLYQKENGDSSQIAFSIISTGDGGQEIDIYYNGNISNSLWTPSTPAYISEDGCLISAPAANGFMRYVKIQLTHEQVMKLHVVPVSIVVSGGENKIFNIHHVYGNMTANYACTGWLGIGCIGTYNQAFMKWNINLLNMDTNFREQNNFSLVANQIQQPNLDLRIFAGAPIMKGQTGDFMTFWIEYSVMDIT